MRIPARRVDPSRLPKRHTGSSDMCFQKRLHGDVRRSADSQTRPEYGFSARSKPRARGYLLLAAAVLLVVACSSPSRHLRPLSDGVGTATSQTISSATIVGKWRGAFHQYPHLYELEIDILAPGPRATHTATVHVRPIPSHSRTARAPLNGTFSAYVNLDPSTRSLEIAPTTRHLQQPRGALRPPSLQGIYSSRLDSIAGYVNPPRPDSSPFFVLGRDKHGEQILSRVRSVAPHRHEGAANAYNAVRSIGEGHNAGGYGRNLFFSVGAPSAAKVRQWATRLATEYPDKKQHSWSERRNLYSDSWVESVFGTPYSAMSHKTRARIAGRLASDSALELRALARGFQWTGTYTDADMMLSALALRVLSAWREVAVQLVHDLPNEREGLKDATRWEAVANRTIHQMWPTELDEFTASVSQSRRRIANDLLPRLVRTASAKSTGLAGARHLAGWAANNTDVLVWADPAVRSQSLAQIYELLDNLLTPLIEPHVAELDNLGTGINATMAGNAWFSQLSSKFGFASSRPPFTDAVDRLHSLRNKHLRESEEVLNDLLQEAIRTSHVEGLVCQVLQVPGDRELSEGRRFVAAAMRRAEEIKKLQEQAIVGVALGLIVYLCEPDVEAPRRDPSPLGMLSKAVASTVRDLALSALLRGLMPEANDAEITTYGVFLGRLLDGEFFELEGTTEEYFVRHAIREYGELYPGEEMSTFRATIIYNLYKQRPEKR